MKIKPPELRFNNPISEEKLDEILDLLDIQSNDTIVDVGGGNGEVLLKMLQNNKAKGILVDLNKKLIAKCEENSKPTISPDRLILMVEDAKAYLKTLAPNSIDCFVCIGSTYIFDNYQNCIKELSPYLKTNGFLLLGESYWKQKPTAEYLKILGGDGSECMYHHENIELPEKMGFNYLYSHVASEDEWNKFEGVYFLEESVEIDNLPEDKKQEKLNNLRAFRNCQFKYGRSTMGFGLYLFEKRN